MEPHDPLGDGGWNYIGAGPKYALAFVDASYGDRRVELVVREEDTELAREVMKKMRKQGQVSGVQPTRQKFDPRDVTTREELERLLMSEAVKLRRIIREAMDAQPEMPDVSHPLIAQFANHQFDRTPGKASWYQTMRVYEYDAGGQSPQAIVLYLTNEGKYFARINGSYANTLGQSREDHKDPIEAIESALNSSPGPRTRLVRDRLVPVGQKIKPDPTAVGLRPYD